MSVRATHFSLDQEADRPQPRLCDHPGCAGAGEFRAPRDRHHLTDYYWFCLDHVKAYNKAWNYYDGLSEDEVEQQLRADTTWHRRTRPLGGWRAREEWLRAAATREYMGERAQAERQAERAARPETEEEKALRVLGLEAPVDFAAVRARYKDLVKRHHPDANGGDRAAEERLKAINLAYGVLKPVLSA